MIEAYAFLAAFTIQILAMSVLYPAWFTRYVRARATTVPAERLAQLYPGVDLDRAQARFLARYRALNTGIVVLGLLLLGWLFSYMQRPNWDDGPVETLTVVYFMVQFFLPFSLVVWLRLEFHKVSKRSLPERKRTAVLQRRGLFDFVSPTIVSIAVLAYFLFAAFVIYVEQHPFAGFAGYLNIGIVTLVYALQAIGIYAMLYGKKSNPFETHADRVHTIGLVVKSCVYACIVCVAFLSLSFTLGLLDLQRWEPFALSVFLVICTLICSMGLIAPPREPRTEGLGPNPVS